MNAHKRWLEIVIPAAIHLTYTHSLITPIRIPASLLLVIETICYRVKINNNRSDVLFLFFLIDLHMNVHRILFQTITSALLSIWIVLISMLPTFVYSNGRGSQQISIHLRMHSMEIFYWIRTVLSVFLLSFMFYCTFDFHIFYSFFSILFILLLFY